MNNRIINTYGVHNSSIARELQFRGFSLVKVEPNKKKPQYSVYHFEDSVELQNAMLEILSRRK